MGVEQAAVINFWTVGRTRIYGYTRTRVAVGERGGRVLHAFTDARDAARFTRQGTACVRVPGARRCVRAAVVWVSRGGHLSSEVCADSITASREREPNGTNAQR